jgi:hypothetical protein
MGDRAGLTWRGTGGGGFELNGKGLTKGEEKGRRGRQRLMEEVVWMWSELQSIYTLECIESLNDIVAVP